MITVEVNFLESDHCITSEPLETTKEEFLVALDQDSYIDFPIKLKDDLGIGTFCISTHLLNTGCYLIFCDV